MQFPGTRANRIQITCIETASSLDPSRAWNIGREKAISFLSKSSHFPRFCQLEEYFMVRNQLLLLTHKFPCFWAKQAGGLCEVQTTFLRPKRWISLFKFWATSHLRDKSRLTFNIRSHKTHTQRTENSTFTTFPFTKCIFRTLLQNWRNRQHVSPPQLWST